MSKWSEILSGERFYDEHPPYQAEGRAFGFSHMQKDVDLVIFSSAFRRMDKKAQVYIESKNDFVRNRLTHTLEVVSIGRMLTGLIVKKLDSVDEETGVYFDKEFFDTKKEKTISKRDIVESVAAACHAHDIGNPPFGHIGEYAIRSWFKTQKRKSDLAETHKELAKIFEDDQIHSNDFIYFDGNPQGFRVITKLQGWKSKGGLRLTYDTLATFFKYVNISNDVRESNPKYGYFQSEKDCVEKIFSKLKLIGKDGEYIRHPFSYIMEAADDIAYCCSDIEDGYKVGLIPYEEASAALYDIALPRITRLGIKDRASDVLRNSGLGDHIKYLRTAATDSLIWECCESFFNSPGRGGTMNYKRMLEGDFKDSLVKISNLYTEYKRGKDLSEKYVYGSKTKILREQGAHQVIRFLLGVFSDAIENWHASSGNIEDLDERSRYAFMIMHRVYDNKGFEREGSEKRIRDIKSCDPIDSYRMMVDFVSGMTDSYALKMARTMRGIDIGEL